MPRPHGIVAILLAFLLWGCCEETAPLLEADDLRVALSLSPAEELGYSITRVTVTIDTLHADMSVAGSMATWSRVAVGPGEHELVLSIYIGSILLAEGTGYVAAIDRTEEPTEITFVDWTDLYPRLPKRVLFIGNSHTYFNEGMDANLMALAASIDSNLCVTAARISGGGLRLDEHWDAGEAVMEIQTGGWDIVSLRGSGGTVLTYPDSYAYYVALFDEEIRQAGGRTALPAMWAGRDYPEIAPIITERIATIAATHDAIILPYATAWAHALAERPEIPIYHADGGHPSPHGTYLSTCIAFVALYGIDPRGATYVTDASITVAERDYLQDLAWWTVREPAGVLKPPVAR